MDPMIRVGIFGDNGHQIHPFLAGNPLARLTATAAFPVGKLPEALLSDPKISHYQTLAELLADPEVDLVSLCSPLRKNQARDAMAVLRAGKHVYAEKPCAMDEAELDEILKTAGETGRQFHEMAGTAFEQPYFAMREIVASGRIGEVVQILAEKSYPYHQGRPQDENVDGGLIGQNAIHGLRMVEQVGLARIARLEKAVETAFGNPAPEGNLRMAAVLLLKLENGGLATVTANYLNPRGSGVWGYESLRILGTLGMVESIRGGESTRLVIGDKDFGPLDVTRKNPDYFECYLRSLGGGVKMPLTLEDELRPTRWAIRAKDAAEKPD